MTRSPLSRSSTSSAAAAASPLPSRPVLPPRWCRGELLGRLVEISGAASLTLTFSLILDAQVEREPVAWITCRDSTFFPPDAFASGVDLASLPVVFVPSAADAARAADHLLRSGAFGLVVLDLGARAELPMPLQSRLVGLAKRHDSVVLCLTVKEARAPSLSSLVSLRTEARRRVTEDGRFHCELRVSKDKRRGPSWSHEEEHHGPPGLC